MKIQNVGLDNAYAIVRGWVNPDAATSGLISVDDGTTSVGPISSIVVDGGTVTDLGGGIVLITIPGATVAYITDGVTTISDISSIEVPLGGVEAGVTATAALRFLTPIYGGQDAVVTVPASGASYTIDCSTGNVFDITLTASCTLSISNPPASGDLGQILVVLRQGGSGSYTVTWPGAVAWQNTTTGGTGGSAPTLFTAVGSQNDVLLSSVDGGTTWGGLSLVAGFLNPMTTRGDIIIENSTPAPARLAIGASGKFLSSNGTDPSWGQGPATTDGDLILGATAGTPTRLASGAVGLVLMGNGVGSLPSWQSGTTLSPTDHEHIMNLWYSGDGATTAFELPAAAFDSQSVRVWVSGTLTDVTLSGTLLTTMTFGSAPASATNNIVVDLVAAAA